MRRRWPAVAALVLLVGDLAEGHAQALPDRLTISGDLRLRHEQDRDRDSRDDRFRNRLRGRLGATLRLTEAVAIETRATTGPRGDPRSPYVTLGAGFDKAEINLDRLYMSWRPREGRLSQLGLWSTVGKFGHSVHHVLPYTELIWDADVQPDGIAAGIAPAFGSSSLAPAFVAGIYVVEEQSDGPDATVTVLQGALRHTSAVGDVSATAGANLYKDVRTSATLVRRNAGNVVTNGTFQSAFRIWTAGLRWQPPVRLWGSSIAIAGEYWKNEGAFEKAEDAGFAIGATYGVLRSAGDLAFYYQYQHVQRESVFSPFTQDDLLLATNFRGHLAGARYRVGTRADLHLWTLLAARDRLTPGIPGADSDRLQKRFRLDIDIRF